MFYSDDLKATNQGDTRVKPVKLPIAQDDKNITLKKHSWNMVRFKY